MTKDNIWKLTGCIQHYPWGGTSFIPELISLSNDEHKPYAELWFGQHPACSSITSGGSALSDLMASSPKTFLTQQENKRWQGVLPFLCKILDVKEMLSIQIHPDKESAFDGFQHEEQTGVERTAFDRTFRDQNHKPEIMYALSDFYLLHDFRDDRHIIEDLRKKPGLEDLANRVEQTGLSDFYRWFMQQSQEQINTLLQPFVERLKKSVVTEDLMNPDYWVKKALDQFCSQDRLDRGILSFYLMNLVHLKPGEVVFQDSGIPHAYLRGQNIEVMANSDNVIRGGLTVKHINTDALGRLVRFDQRAIHIIEHQQVDQSFAVYVPPVEEFKLSVISLEPYQQCQLNTSNISLFFSTCNCFMVHSEHQELRVSGGEAVLVRAGESIFLKSRIQAKVFMVTTQV